MVEESVGGGGDEEEEGEEEGERKKSTEREQTPQQVQCCKIAKFDPFLSLDCARVEGVGAQSKERKGSNFAA